MKYSFILLILLFLTSVTFAQSKNKANNIYDISTSKMDSKKSTNGSQICLRVYDPLNRECFSYILVINGLILKNENESTPLTLSVVPGSSMMIECFTYTYKDVTLPKLIPKKGELTTVIIHLTDNNTASEN